MLTHKRFPSRDPRGMRSSLELPSPAGTVPLMPSHGPSAQRASASAARARALVVEPGSPLLIGPWQEYRLGAIIAGSMRVSRGDPAPADDAGPREGDEAREGALLGASSAPTVAAAAPGTEQPHASARPPQPPPPRSARPLSSPRSRTSIVPANRSASSVRAQPPPSSSSSSPTPTERLWGAGFEPRPPVDLGRVRIAQRVGAAAASVRTLRQHLCTPDANFGSRSAIGYLNALAAADGALGELLALLEADLGEQSPRSAPPAHARAQHAPAPVAAAERRPPLRRLAAEADGVAQSLFHLSQASELRGAAAQLLVELRAGPAGAGLALCAFYEADGARKTLTARAREPRDGGWPAGAPALAQRVGVGLVGHVAFEQRALVTPRAARHAAYDAACDGALLGARAAVAVPVHASAFAEGPGAPIAGVLLLVWEAGVELEPAAVAHARVLAEWLRLVAHRAGGMGALGPAARAAAGGGGARATDPSFFYDGGAGGRLGGGGGGRDAATERVASAAAGAADASKAQMRAQLSKLISGRSERAADTPPPTAAGPPAPQSSVLPQPPQPQPPPIAALPFAASSLAASAPPPPPPARAAAAAPALDSRKAAKGKSPRGAKGGATAAARAESGGTSGLNCWTPEPPDAEAASFPPPHVLARLLPASPASDGEPRRRISVGAPAGLRAHDDVLRPGDAADDDDDDGGGGGGDARAAESESELDAADAAPEPSELPSEAQTAAPSVAARIADDTQPTARQDVGDDAHRDDAHRERAGHAARAETIDAAGAESRLPSLDETIGLSL